MENKDRNGIKQFLERLYGGLNMSWPVVIIYAVATAVLTAVFLILPVFGGTSFVRMGVDMEAWIFFAVIIIANCKKPLESALKVFVFFLISQPLIYLFQVPFSDLGWGLFRYYTYWFIWTLLTFPMAYFGWNINRKDWISVLIFAPVLALLGLIVQECGGFAIRHFPKLLAAAMFCIAQIVIYCSVFFPDWKNKAAGLLIPVITAVVMIMITPQVNLNALVYLPDDPVFTESAAVITEDDPFATLTVFPSEDGTMIRVQTKKYGTMDFSIIENGEEYRYTLEIYEDDAGYPQVRITAR